MGPTIFVKFLQYEEFLAYVVVEAGSEYHLLRSIKNPKRRKGGL